mmetsp:Transcript_32795/g.53577  ORF Transcript_32795/g.53577 Transcript_32795/m.53577 type:complete len:80 (+) Transcript_32795:273-512(+)
MGCEDEPGQSLEHAAPKWQAGCAESVEKGAAQAVAVAQPYQGGSNFPLGDVWGIGPGRYRAPKFSWIWLFNTAQQMHRL